MTGSDFVEQAKGAAVVLTSLSGVAYACGYLAVRARARAIGADPGFLLVDQAYVFAGFRFVVLLMLSLLIAAPALLTLRWLAARALPTAAGPLAALEWGAIAVAAVATLWAYLVTTRVNGVLLAPSSDWAARAALEGGGASGFLFTLGATAGAAALLLWTRAHFRRAGALDPLGAALALVCGLLIVLLPVEHGVFHADRTARRLDGAPAGLGGLAVPIWVVDRTADRVTLLGRGADGRLKLAAVKADALDGVAVVKIGSLSDAVADNP
jgi:hypothetical protein